jgi:acyl carrier protein
MTGVASQHAMDRMIERLVLIMEREVENLRVPRAERGADSISRLALDSVALLGFLVAVEDEFDFEWDPDVDPGVVQSLDAMAAYVLSNGRVLQSA